MRSSRSRRPSENTTNTKADDPYVKKNFIPENELLFLALGGSGEIGMNVNLYGCDGKWLMVDLGMTFSGNEYPGVDLVFADLEFIEERTRDLLGS